MVPPGHTLFTNQTKQDPFEAEAVHNSNQILSKLSVGTGQQADAGLAWCGQTGYCVANSPCSAMSSVPMQLDTASAGSKPCNQALLDMLDRYALQITCNSSTCQLRSKHLPAICPHFELQTAQGSTSSDRLTGNAHSQPVHSAAL